MRILVISDTHGEISRACNVYDRLISRGPVDLIIHCGDNYRDAVAIEQRTGCPMVGVKGNTDGCFDENNFAKVDTEYGAIFVTHGHMESVDYSQQGLYYKAKENDCCAALFGHTHRAVFTEACGIYLMNPGSLSRPRDGSGGTFGLITTSSDRFRGSIYHYEDFMKEDGNGPSPGSNVQGGFLRSIFNYSDSF